MRRIVLLGLGVLVTWGYAACSSSSTNPAADGGAGGAGASGGTGGEDASVGGTGGGSGDASLDVPPVETGTPTCDPNEVADAGAVFVSPTGSDTTGSGSKETPLATIGQAIKLAAASSAKLVVLDQGSYPEKVLFDDTTSGVTVRGGFKKTGTAWSRDCDAGAREKTAIVSPENIAVQVNDVKAALQSLSVLTKAQGATTPGAPGESLYGVYVTGDTASVSLSDVRVVAGAGGDGGTATKVVAGAKSSCDGITGCADGSSGTNATPGKDGLSSTFDMSGHIPGNAGDGTQAGAGKNGTPGDIPNPATGCWYQGCNGDCVNSGCLNQGPQHNESGGQGKCGCGGKGGDSGGGGFGGGASVALFVAGKGVVTVAFSELTSLQGGKGSAGSLGTGGIAGTAGTQGAATTCWGACSKPSNCATSTCQQASTQAPGGAKGGDGGKGGEGMEGGDGSGGSSIAVVRVGGALVTLSDGSVPNPDKGGLGAGSAPAGASPPTNASSSASHGPTHAFGTEHCLVLLLQNPPAHCSPTMSHAAPVASCGWQVPPQKKPSTHSSTATSQLSPAALRAWHVPVTLLQYSAASNSHSRKVNAGASRPHGSPMAAGTWASQMSSSP